MQEELDQPEQKEVTHELLPKCRAAYYTTIEDGVVTDIKIVSVAITKDELNKILGVDRS